MMRLDSEIESAYAQERDALLRKTARDLGYTGEAASDFSSMVSEICDATTPNGGGARSVVITSEHPAFSEENRLQSVLIRSPCGCRHGRLPGGALPRR